MTKIIGFLKFIFHISVLFLIILSLFPGSLIGYFLYDDFAQQPDLIKNPIGTSINHFISYLYVSLLGFFLYLRSQNFNKVVFGLLFFSAILEVLQIVVPNRSFQWIDLFANILGVIVAYFVIKIYLSFKKP